MHTFYQRERGQALVLVTLAFIVLVGFLGLALDGANAFGQRRRISNAADAASLAATRALVAVKAAGDNGAAINDAIDEYLVSVNGIDASSSTWQASYVSRYDPDTVLEPVDDNAAPPADAGGVQIDLDFTFDTNFMRLMGQRTLTVSAHSTSIFGPLGTAVGSDLIPIGISDSAMNNLLDRGHVRVDLKGNIMQAYSYLLPGEQLPELVADVVTQANFAYVNLSDIPSDDLPNANGCRNPNVSANLTYWMCNGTQTQMNIGRLLETTDQPWGQINESIIQRVNTENNPTAIVPVYVQVPDGDGGIALQLAYFVAVRLTYNADNISNKYVTMTLLDDYVSAGAMVGEGSGVETGAWAVNLKR